MKFNTNSLNFKKGLNEVNKSLSNTGRNAKNTSKKFAHLQKQLKKTGNRFSNITKDANRLNSSMLKLGKGIGSLASFSKSGIAIATLYALGRGFSSAIQGALDMIEVNNLFVVSLGSASNETLKFIENLNDLTGLDITNLQSAVGTFALLGRSMGINADNSAKLSKSMVSLALDLSSLTNVPINQVMQDLRSGLVGQSETVYKYGLDVTEASLKQEAMNQGIEKSVRNMSQGEKMALRYSVMIKRSSLAHSDFAKTLESPANQLRILGERFTTLTRAIGTVFIPTLGYVLPYLNAILEVLIDIIQSLAILVGYRPTEAEGALGGLADGANEVKAGVDGINDSLKRTTAGFDELNLLNKSSGSGGGVSGGDPNIFNFEEHSSLLENIETKSSQIADNIRQFFADLTATPSISKLIDEFEDLRYNIEDVLLQTGFFKEVYDEVGYLTSIKFDFSNFEFLIQDILRPLAKFTIDEGVITSLESFNGSLETLSDILYILEPILNRIPETETWKPSKNSLFGLRSIPVLNNVIMLVDALEAFGEWLSEHKYDLRKFTEIIGLDLDAFSKTWSTEFENAKIWTIDLLGEMLKDMEAEFSGMHIGFKVGFALLDMVWRYSFGSLKSLASIDVDRIIKLMSEKFSKMHIGFEVGFTVLDKVWGDSFGSLTTQAGVDVDGIKDLMAEKFGKVPDDFKNIFELVQIKFQSWRILTSLWIRQNVPKMVEDFKNFWLELPQKLYDIGYDAITSLWDGFKSRLSWFKDKVSDFVNDVFDFDIEFSGTSNVSTQTIDSGGSADEVGYWGFKSDQLEKYANGGFPSQGQMFIARESGAELVGSINGSTAVANNDQIVEAVSKGVANAVASVLGEQVVNVNLDSKTIASSVTNTVKRASTMYGKEVSVTK